MWNFAVIGICFLLPIVMSIIIWFLRRFIFAIGPALVIIVTALYGVVWLCGDKYFIDSLEVSNSLDVILNIFLGVGFLTGVIILDRSYDAVLSGRL